MGIALGAVVGSQAIRAIANYSDAWTTAESKIKLVTSSSFELHNTQSKLLALANETRQSLSATTTLYTRITRSTEQLNLTDIERLRLTETINKALVVSGATTQEAQSTITQLSQAMASGVLRGEEFNSVSENGSEIMNILSKSMGKTIGELRSMAKEGQITTDVLIEGLAAGAESVDEKFEQMGLTIAQSHTILSNNLTAVVGSFNEVTGATELYGKAIEGVNVFLERMSWRLEGITNDFGFEREAILKSIEAQELYYAQQRKILGLEKNTQSKKASLKLIKETALFLEVEWKTLEGLTEAELNFASAAKVSNDELIKRDLVARQAEDSDMAYFNAQIKVLEISDQVEQQNREETQSINDKIDAINSETAAITQQVNTKKELGYFDEGYEYTTTTYANNIFGSFNTSIDKSTSYIDSFNTTVNTTDNSLQEFERAISNTINGLSNGMRSLSSIFSSSSLSPVSYQNSLSSARTAQQNLINNPLSTQSSAEYAAAYNQFTSSASTYLGQSSNFGSSREQSFARAGALLEDSKFQDTALLSYDVQEETKLLLESIDVALADGLLTQEEKDKITDTAKSINDKNDLLLGSGTVLAKDASIIQDTNSVTDALDNLKLTGGDVNVDMTELERLTGEVEKAVTGQDTYLTAISDSNGSIKSYTAGNLDQFSSKGKVKSVSTQNHGTYVAGYTNSLTGENVPGYMDYAQSTGSTTSYTYYKQGGYTGNMGVNQEAGIVHGQEYVVNAQTTSDLGLNGSGGVFQQMNNKLDMLAHLYEINKTTKKSFNVENAAFIYQQEGN